MGRIWAFSFMILLWMLCEISAQGHFEEYIYDFPVTVRRCHQVQTKKCWHFLFFGSCKWVSTTVCNDYTDIVKKVGKKCQTGWRDYPGNCDIPICNNPSCSGGKMCISPNVCACVIPQGGCTSVACNDAKNCYPGSCQAANSTTCTCPAGFSGDNCQTVERRPDIRQCKGTFYSGSPAKVVGEVECIPTGVTSDPVWMNASQISSVQVTYRVEYNEIMNVPDRGTAPHVANSPVVLGVMKSSVSSAEYNRDCSVPTGSNGNPVQFVDCVLPLNWASVSANPPTHNQIVTLNIAANIGGHKIGAKDINYPGSFFDRQDFTGIPQTASLAAKFDLQAPVHCLTGINTIEAANASCDQFAIHLDHDVSMNQTFRVYFRNWTDADSGVEGYHIDVYWMQPGSNDILQNSGSPVNRGDSDTTSHSYSFVLTKSGVYAVELTVKDRAGNEAKARKILLYDKDSKIELNKDKPIVLREADPATGGQWLTSYEPPRDEGFIPLTVEWKGHFSSNARYGAGWANAVQPWNRPNAIDDNFGSLYGLRSIDPMTVSGSGIVVYNLAYAVDNQGGRGLTYTNRSFISLNPSVEQYSLPIRNLSDGETIVVWINANDITGSGNEVFEKLVIHVDKSRPNISSATFKQKSVDEFTSSIYIGMIDDDSGIKEIRYVIYDKTVGTIPVYNGTADPKLRDYPELSGRRKRDESSILRPCTADDATCYCTPQRVCYSVQQEIRIDHCTIDRLAGHSFLIKYVVVNMANLPTTENIIDLGELIDIPCRKHPLSPEEIAGITIGLLLGVAILAILVFILVTVVRMKVYHKPKPGIVNRFEKTFRRENKSTDNELYLPSDEIQSVARPNPGPRSPNNGPPVRINAAFNAVTEDNCKNSPPPYSAAPMQSQSSSIFTPQSVEIYNHVQSGNLKYEEEIGKGRFAVIFKVRCLGAGQKNAIAAAKKLRSGHDVEDVELMKKKINFLKHMVPPHPNIVRYVGDTEEGNGGNPILLMEYCDINLVDWLKSVDDINDDVANQMITISLNIARGMEHLHKNNIIHSRLAARNVLINRPGSPVECVAKLIGFGPMSEKNMKETPKQWLAPETIESMRQQPTFNKKTDSWSYGVVLWEIFSKGKDPYADVVARNKILDYLKSGKRMGRPVDMPQEIYDDIVTLCWKANPNERPEFSQICASVIAFRDATEQPLYRADDDNDDDGGYFQQGIYDDAI